MTAARKVKIGGLLLIIGALVILTTIYFEYRVGWIGGPERNRQQTVTFIFENWSIINVIWTWQLIGHILLTIAYFLVVLASKSIKRIFWSLLVVSGIAIIIAFIITLRSYYPALAVYNSNPLVFDSISAIISPMYQAGRLGLLLYMVVFVLEVFGKDGRISRSIGITVIVITLISLLIGAATSIPIKLTGVTWLLLPMVMGYYYLRNYESKT